MLKADEVALMASIQVRDLFQDSLPIRIRYDIYLPSALDISKALNIPYKRSRYILLKWAYKDLYEYGVSWRVGWLTTKGKLIIPESNWQTWIIEKEPS